MEVERARLWLQWLWVNVAGSTVGFTLGLISTPFLGLGVSISFDESRWAIAFAIIGAPVGALIGFVIGMLQRSFLQKWISQSSWWVLTSAAGFIPGQQWNSWCTCPSCCAIPDRFVSVRAIGRGGHVWPPVRCHPHVASQPTSRSRAFISAYTA
jgi:hypothetical protein